MNLNFIGKLLPLRAIVSYVYNNIGEIHLCVLLPLAENAVWFPSF